MELLSSHTNLRFLDVKGRPEVSQRPSPLPTSETDSDTFATRMDEQRASQESVRTSERGGQDASQEVIGDQPAVKEDEAPQDAAPVNSVPAKEEETPAAQIEGSKDWSTQGGEAKAVQAEAPAVAGQTQQPAAQQIAQGMQATMGSSVAGMNANGGDTPEVPAEKPATPVGTQPTLATQPMQGMLAASALNQALNQAPKQEPTGNTAAKVEKSTGKVEVLESTASLGIGSVPAEIEAAPVAQEAQGDAPMLQSQLPEALEPVPVEPASTRLFEGQSLENRAPQQLDSVGKAQAVASTPNLTSAGDMVRSEAVLSQVNAKIQPGLQRASLRLNPEELGRVGIEMTVDKGEVRAEMRVESKEALQILQRHLPELRAMFAQANLELTELNFLLQDEAGQFDWDGQDTDPGQQQSNKGSGSASKNTNQTNPDGQEAEWTTLSLGQGNLDLLA